ncbi:xanthine dehydrogenase accessory protein XdhC [Segnochrobactraceae bacterium EtOH-i3]
MELWARIAALLVRDGVAALVTVVTADGSTPREAGARMAVGRDGGFSGTIGGGALEWQALAFAQSEMAAGVPRARLRTIALGPELGQCCGGRVTVLVETFAAADLPALAPMLAAEKEGPFSTVAGRDAAGRFVRQVVAEAGGDPAAGTARLTADGRLEERFGITRRPLYLFGAGHVGRALVLALAPLPFAVTWVDPRPEAFPGAMPGNVMPVAPAEPEQLLATAPDGAFVLVLTHSHALDFAIVHAALAAERFPYVGLIGSATKRARFTSRLRAAGVAEERIAGMICPIGGARLVSKHPAPIAALTVAELVLADEAARAAVPDVTAAATAAGAR